MPLALELRPNSHESVLVMLMQGVYVDNNMQVTIVRNLGNKRTDTNVLQKKYLFKILTISSIGFQTLD